MEKPHTKKLTDQQLQFLGFLANEAKGNIDEAMKLAGYAPSSKSSLVKSLKEEIVEVAMNTLSGATLKAALSLIELLDNPTKPGAETVIKAAKEVLNRAGIVHQEELGMKVPSGGLLILPAKGKRIVEEDDNAEEERS